SVFVHSAGLGQGTEFVVRLPLGAKPVHLRDVRGDEGKREAPVTHRRILVVDDNRDAAESLALLLGLEGHAVQLAHDGLEAVEAAATFLPDVVLLDIGLPKVNGYEAARRIRKSPGKKSVLLVALT